MNFGMFTDFHVRKGASQSEAFDESFTQITEAEQMGFDTVWLAEHHFSPERAVLASPMVIAKCHCRPHRAHPHWPGRSGVLRAETNEAAATRSYLGHAADTLSARGVSTSASVAAD